MFLVVGLGNPGPKYAGHRHNVGFRVVDVLARKWDAGELRDACSGRLAVATFRGERVALLQPSTFMNRSGASVREAMIAHEVPLANVVVAHDELDLPFGTLRIKVGGGTAGHRGLESMVEHAGGPDFVRLRVGVGRPPPGVPTVEWVLADFPSEDAVALAGVCARAADAVETVLIEGPREAMNRFHRPDPEPPAG